MMAAKSSGSSGGAPGSAARISPGRVFAITGRSARVSW